MQAATRGDGREGEDVTHNVSLQGAVQGLHVSVPASAGGRAMPAEFEVRGEVYITSSDFQKVCGSELQWVCDLGGSSKLVSR